MTTNDGEIKNLDDCYDNDDNGLIERTGKIVAMDTALRSFFVITLYDRDERKYVQILVSDHYRGQMFHFFSEEKILTVKCQNLYFTVSYNCNGETASEELISFVLAKELESR